MPRRTTPALDRLAAGAAALWVYAAAACLDGRRTFRPLDPTARPRSTPLVSVVIPARDEAHAVGATLDSLAALDWPRLEVLVVDDESRDGTWAAISAASARHPVVHGIRGGPLPAGWVGKQWALDQGVRAAAGSWLLFSDADVRHAPASLRAALARAEEVDGGGVTVAPEIETGGLGERLLQAAAVVCISAFFAPAFLVRSGRTSVAIAAGGYILVRREAYEAAGGHAAVRRRMLDDVAIAEVLKRRGTPLRPAGSAGLVRVRMYRSLGEALAGWRKSASHGIRGHRLAGAGAAVLLATAALTPCAALVLGIRRRRMRPALLGAVGYGALVGARLASGTLLPGPRRDAPLLPLGLCGIAVVTLRSTLDRARGGPVWRGRRYPQAE